MDDLYVIGQQCLERIVRYHYDIDRGAATEGIGNFVDHAVFEAHGELYEGREAILGFLRKREANQARKTVHVITCPRFGRTEDGDIEVGAIGLINVQGEDGVFTCSRVLDLVHSFEGTPNGWLIKARRSKPLHHR